MLIEANVKLPKLFLVVNEKHICNYFAQVHSQIKIDYVSKSSNCSNYCNVEK